MAEHANKPSPEVALQSIKSFDSSQYPEVSKTILSLPPWLQILIIQYYNSDLFKIYIKRLAHTQKMWEERQRVGITLEESGDARGGLFEGLGFFELLRKLKEGEEAISIRRTQGIFKAKGPLVHSPDTMIIVPQADRIVLSGIGEFSSNESSDQKKRRQNIAYADPDFLKPLLTRGRPENTALQRYLTRCHLPTDVSISPNYRAIYICTPLGFKKNELRGPREEYPLPLTRTQLNTLAQPGIDLSQQRLLTKQVAQEAVA